MSYNEKRQERISKYDQRIKDILLDGILKANTSTLSPVDKSNNMYAQIKYLERKILRLKRLQGYKCDCENNYRCSL